MKNCLYIEYSVQQKSEKPILMAGVFESESHWNDFVFRQATMEMKTINRQKSAIIEKANPHIASWEISESKFPK